MANSSDSFARTAKKVVLPTFVLTEVCQADDKGAVRIPVPDGATSEPYYERPKLTDSGARVDGKPKWQPSQFNIFPLVLDATGLPWPEANVYLLSRLQNSPDPAMTTFDGIADDLAAYRRFLDKEEIDWLHFPRNRLSRPTYRYSADLNRSIQAGTVAASSAKRRMSTVVGFYNWLISEAVFTPEHSPWRASDAYIKIVGAHGFEFTKSVTTTDVAIKVPKQNDPYAGTIDDGGKLRPLSGVEQRWVLDALVSQGNTEMTLLHLLALATGARIQTALTFRVGHVQRWTDEELQKPTHSELHVPVGPGTGIDTKRNKRMVLHVPVWLARALFTYVHSERAISRRALAKRGDIPQQYLFLTRYGMPFYSSREDTRTFDPSNKLRQPIKGQSVRKFMGEVIIPHIRSKFNPEFRYQFHDLRASFGMNLTDKQLALVERKKRSLSQVREFVKVRMGHESASVTDRYLQFRGNLTHVLQVQDDHDTYLLELAEKAGLL